MWMQPDQNDRRDRQQQQEREEQVAQAATMLVVTAVLAVLWPLMAVMAVTVAAAWATGMHYARILRAALWSLSMTGTFVVAATVQDRHALPDFIHEFASREFLSAGEYI